jgi:hypothetical protein
MLVFGTRINADKHGSDLITASVCGASAAGVLPRPHLTSPFFSLAYFSGAKQKTDGLKDCHAVRLPSHEPVAGSSVELEDSGRPDAWER